MTQDRKRTEFPILRTERLVLRDWQPEDAQSVFEMRSDPEHNAYTGRVLANNKGEAIVHIKRIMNGNDSGEWINWAISIPDTNLMIGSLGYWNYSEKGDQAELGYELHKNFRGRGFMTEALSAILDYARVHSTVEIIDAKPHQKNEPSIRLLRHFGFHQVKGYTDKEDSGMTLWRLNI